MSIASMLGQKSLGKAITKLVMEAAKTAKDIADLRQKVAKGIAEGDLDGALEKFQSANDRAEKFIKTGT